MIKSLEEKRLEFRHHLFAIFKTPIIYFPPLQRHHIMKDGTIFHIRAFQSLSKYPFQQAKSFTTQLGITYTNLTRLTIVFHRALTYTNLTRLTIVFHRALVISQCSKRWSTDSPLFLHIQHQSTIMTCCFLRLSMIKIFPKVID
jgi:hypothetical protein